MKLLSIGDTHGRSYWKHLVHTQEFDRLVFLGDYFDAPDINAPEQLNNFRDIVAYKEAAPDKVVLLTGNHDFHYLPVAMAVGRGTPDFKSGMLPKSASCWKNIRVCFRCATSGRTTSLPMQV